MRESKEASQSRPYDTREDHRELVKLTLSVLDEIYEICDVPLELSLYRRSI